MPKDDDFDRFVNDVLSEPAAEFSNQNTRSATVLLSSISTVPGKSILECRGLITARCVVGQAGFSKLKAALSDAFGRRSEATEKILMKIEQECFRQLREAAHARGCQAVVGTSFRIGELSGEADLLYGTASGTAVIVE